MEIINQDSEFCGSMQSILSVPPALYLAKFA